MVCAYMQFIYVGSKRLLRKDISAFGTLFPISPTRFHVLLSIPILCPPEPREPKQRARRGKQACFTIRTAFPHGFGASRAGPRNGTAFRLHPQPPLPKTQPLLLLSFPSPELDYSPHGSLRTMSAWTAVVSLLTPQPTALPSGGLLGQVPSHASPGPICPWTGRPPWRPRPVCPDSALDPLPSAAWRMRTAFFPVCHIHPRITVTFTSLSPAPLPAVLLFRCTLESGPSSFSPTSLTMLIPPAAPQSHSLTPTTSIKRATVHPTPFSHPSDVPASLQRLQKLMTLLPCSSS